MIAVVQRVSEASVTVGEEEVGKIGRGLVALVAVVKDDAEGDVKWMARKLTELRIFRSQDREKHFELDVTAAGGSVLLVSNFTVAGATRQGRRPSFDAAAGAVQGAAVFNVLVETIRAAGIPVQTGRFGADMVVRLVNDGPVTVLLNSADVRGKS